MNKNTLQRKTSKDLISYDISDNNAIKNFIDIEEMSCVQYMYPKMANEMHSHNFYLITWYFKGSGIFKIDFIDSEIEDDCIFFISPGQIHNGGNAHNFNGVAIAFTEDFLENISPNIKKIIKQQIFTFRGSVSSCHVNSQGHERLYCIFQKMKDLYAHPESSLYYKECMSVFLSYFLFEALNIGIWNNPQTKMKNSSGYQLYLNFIDAVDKNFQKLHTVGDYAKLLGTSIASLNLGIKNITNKTPAMIISDRLIIEAKKILIINPELRIKEIAFILGFEDNSNFVKFFKRNVGMSPAEYRELS